MRAMMTWSTVQYFSHAIRTQYERMQPNPALANDMETPDAVDADACVRAGDAVGASDATPAEHTPLSLQDGAGPSGAGQAITPGEKV